MYLVNYLKQKKFIKSSTGLFVILFSSIIFVFFYWTDINRPGVLYSLGWYQIWSDQSQYYNMVQGIAHGNLGNFQYPIGYPFLGYLSSLIFPKDPFLLVDLVIFDLVIYLSYEVYSSFFNEALSILGVIFLSMTSVSLFYIPWTSTVSALSFIFVIYIFVKKKYNLLFALLAGISLALAFAARIADIVPVGIAFTVYLIGMFKYNKDEFKRSSILSFLTMLIIVVVTTFINYKFSGSILGPYTSSILSQGFNVRAIPFKIYGYLINAYTFHGEANHIFPPLLRYNFLFIFIPFGLFYMLRNRKDRLFGWLITASFIGWSILYIPFVAITGFTLKYGSLHYIKMFFPLFVLISLYAISKMVYESSKFKYLNIYLIVVVLIGLIFVKGLEFKEMDLSSVNVTSNVNSSQAYKAIDKNLATRWDSESPQKKEMEFEIDLKKAQMVNRILLDCSVSPNDYPRQFTVWYSLDGKRWSKYFGGNQSNNQAIVNIYMEPISCRFLKIVLNNDDPVYWWSIYELKIWSR